MIEARPEADVVPAAPPTDASVADGDDAEAIEEAKVEAEPAPESKSEPKRARAPMPMTKSKKSAAKSDAPASGGCGITNARPIADAAATRTPRIDRITARFAPNVVSNGDRKK